MNLLKKIINERTTQDTVLLVDAQKELSITNMSKTTSATEQFTEVFRLDGDIPKNWEIEDAEGNECYLQDLPEDAQDDYILEVLSNDGVEGIITETLEKLGVPESSIVKFLAA